MVSETSRPPVLEQTRRKAVTIVAGFEIAVMHQDFERIRDPPRRVVGDLAVQPFEAQPCVRHKHVLGRCLGENLHGNGIAVALQAFLEARLIVHEVGLPRRPQKYSAIDLTDVLHRHPVTVLHSGEVPHTREEGLHMMRNADAQRFVHCVRHTVLH